MVFTAIKTAQFLHEIYGKARVHELFNEFDFEFQDSDFNMSTRDVSRFVLTLAGEHTTERYKRGCRKN